jgi:hypothetical protein
MKDSIEGDSFYAASNAARVEADAKIADRFFPTTAKEPDEESKANETMRESESVEERNARHTETLFSESRLASYGSALSDTMNSLVDQIGATPEQRDAILREHAMAFDDAGITPERAVGIHTLLANHVAAPADDATVDGWAAESRRRTRERYGAVEAERRMEIAKEFIKKRPGLAELLNTTGLGSHPDIVAALVEKPDMLRMEPRTSKKA